MNNIFSRVVLTTLLVLFGSFAAQAQTLSVPPPAGAYENPKSTPQFTLYELEQMRLLLASLDTKAPAVSSGATPVRQTASVSTTAVTFTQGRTAVTTAGTPVVLTGAGVTLVESVEIHARKNTTTANTGAVYVGFSSSAGSNYRVLLPGEVWPITASAGKKLDIHLIYVDAATSADAVTWTATN